MKATTHSGSRNRSDFYSSTLATTNRSREIRFSAVDIVILAVLFLEIAGVMRLFLAN